MIQHTIISLLSPWRLVFSSTFDGGLKKRGPYLKLEVTFTEYSGSSDQLIYCELSKHSLTWHCDTELLLFVFMLFYPRSHNNLSKYKQKITRPSRVMSLRTPSFSFHVQGQYHVTTQKE